MVYVNARVGTCPIAYLCSAGARLHLGKQERVPPAFLVLHAPLSRSLIVQGDMLDATPGGLPAACWQIQIRLPELCLTRNVYY